MKTILIQMEQCSSGDKRWKSPAAQAHRLQSWNASKVSEVLGPQENKNGLALSFDSVIPFCCGISILHSPGELCGFEEDLKNHNSCISVIISLCNSNSGSDLVSSRADLSQLPPVAYPYTICSLHAPSVMLAEIQCRRCSSSKKNQTNKQTKKPKTSILKQFKSQCNNF